MKRYSAALALIPLLCGVASADPLDLPLLWRAELDTLLEAAAVVADVNGDGRQEVVIAGQSGVFALSGDGKVLWRFQSPGESDRFATYPALLQRPTEGCLVYAAHWGGRIVCLDGAGHEVWTAPLNGPSVWSAAVVCDLTGDGQPEVIQTDAKGTVWCFDALTGRVVWKAEVEGEPVSPAVADLDGDGRQEIVVATGAGVITALRSDGSELWTRTLGGTSPSWQTSAPVVFHAASGAARVAVGSSAGQAFCLDAAGEIVWQRPTHGPVTASLSVADFNGDGQADIFLVTEPGVLYRFREDGRPLWVLDTHMRTLAPGAIADINADGHLEYALSAQNGRLLVLGQQGESLLDRPFEHRTINATPAFGDLMPDRAGLEMVIPGGESGRVLCFGTPAKADASRPWPSYRHDAARSGAASPVAPAPGVMRPVNLAWDQILSGQAVRFTITRPGEDRQRLTASASCLRPDGVQQATTMGITSGRAELLLPVEVAAPGTYAFAWGLADSEGRPIASGAQEVFLQPFANDRALAGQAVGVLHSVSNLVEATLPLSAAALRREARVLEAAADELRPEQEAALSPQADLAARAGALERTAALTASAQRALRIAEVVRQAAAFGPGTSVIAFEPANPWESRAVGDALPDRVEAPLTIQRRALPGEHQPVALNLFNVTNRMVRVRVQSEGAEDGPAVAAYRAMGVPTPMGEIAWDALPELDETGAVAIPSLSCVQLWLDFDLAGVSAGSHEVLVRLQAIDGAGVLEGPTTRTAVAPPETQVTVSLDVLPFEMAKPGAFRLCTWGYVESSQFRGYADATYENLLAHGNNVFPVGGLPAAQYDAQGALSAPLDYSTLDAAIGRFRGRDVMILLQGFAPLSPQPGAGEYASPAYRKALKAYLDDVAAHMAGLGFSTEQFALYPVDEPGGHGWPMVRRLVEFNQMVREARPDLMLYTNGGGDVPMFEALAPVTDIWCPGVNQVAQELDKMEILRRSGKYIWSYDCGYSNATAAGRTLKAGDVVAAYRAAAIFAFRYGLTGAGFWTSITGAEDPWTRTEGFDYMMLYPGRTGPVTSRRWEAVREGIEDFRILAALRSRLEAPGSALTEEARSHLERLFEVSVPRFVDEVMNYQDLPQDLDAQLAAVRGEMMDCVAEIAQSSPRP